MNRLKCLLIMFVLTVLPAVVCLGEFDINYRNVSNPRLLERLLNDRIGTLDSEVTALQALSGGLYDNTGTGSIFYVDSGAAADGAGTTWATAVDTLKEGIALCTGNAGDIIYVAQGHKENINAASALNANIAGITIVGIGSGEDMPQLSLITDAGAELTISAADVTLYNIRILGAYTGGVTAGVVITADGDGARIIGCDFWETSNTMEQLIMVSVAADADYLTFAYNRFIGTDSANPSSAITFAGGSDKTVIQNNTFIGTWSGPVIDHTTALSTGIMIVGNYVVNLDATAGKTIQLHGSANGALIGNKCYANGAGFALVGDAMFVSPDNIAMQTENVETRNFETMFGPYRGDAAGTAGDSIFGDFVLAQTDLDAILADTALWDTTAELQTILFGSATAGSTATATAAVQATADAIEVDTGTDIPATLSGINTAIASIDATGFAASATSDPASTVIVECTTLANFGNDYFNTGWSLKCMLDISGVGSAPEGEIFDIIDYVSATGTFTVSEAFTAKVTTGDGIWVFRQDELNLKDDTILGCAGVVRYVDSGAAGDATGLILENAHLTFAAAEAASSAGDVIYIADGHDEEIGDVVIDVANLTVIGMGEGDARPLMTCDASTDEITITGAGVTMKNIRFEPGADQVVTVFRVESTGVGCTLENLSFIRGEANNEEFVICIDVDATAFQLTVKDCTYHNTYATTAHASCFIDLTDGTIDGCTITGCNLFGEFANGAIYSNQVCTNLSIIDNVTSNTTSTKYAIQLSAAATGVLVNNTLYSDSYLTMLDPGSLKCSGNLGVDAIDQQAIAIPLSAETSDVTEVAAGSNLERLEWLQKQTDDIAAQLGIDSTADNVFYVDASVAGGSGLGTSWLDAEATLVLAIGDATTNTGAYIFVASNHAENIVGSVAVNKAGISIIGLGVGESRPIFTFDTANDSLAHTVPDVKYKNLIFTPSTQDNTVGISLDASSDGATFEDCVFRNNTTNEFTNLITLAGGCDDVRFTRCQFINDTAVGAHVAAIENISNPVDNLIIEDCQFHGTFTTAAIHSTKIDTNLMIRNNTIYNYSPSDYAIKLTTTALGTMYGNKCYTPTYGTCIDPGSLQCFDNYISHVIDESGFLFPSAPVTNPAIEGTGRIIYVDSGATAGGGGTWATALNTIDAAMDLTSANRGDIIYVAQGHKETEDTGAIFTADVAGVSIIGISSGSSFATVAAGDATDNQMPVFILDNAAATISVTAANVTLKGLKIESDVIDCAVGITAAAGADGLVVDGCYFRDGAAAEELVIGISIATTCSDVQVKNCYFSTYAAGGCANAILLAGSSDDSIFENNIANGTYLTGAFLATAAASRNLTLIGNTFCNQGVIAVDLNAATTGIMKNNYLAGTTSIAAALTDVDAMWLFENYVSGEDNKSGLLDPVADGD